MSGQFEATAWNNGAPSSSGAGYGLKVSVWDRDTYFKREWKTIRLLFPGSKHAVNINIDKDSFWSETCREMIHKDVGAWLLESKFAPWPKGRPPSFSVLSRGSGLFEVVDKMRSE